jgi:hypothetical protein
MHHLDWADTADPALVFQSVAWILPERGSFRTRPAGALRLTRDTIRFVPKSKKERAFAIPVADLSYAKPGPGGVLVRRSDRDEQAHYMGFVGGELTYEFVAPARSAEMLREVPGLAAEVAGSALTLGAFAIADLVGSTSHAFKWINRVQGQKQAVKIADLWLQALELVTVNNTSDEEFRRAREEFKKTIAAAFAANTPRTQEHAQRAEAAGWSASQMRASRQ